MSQAIGNWTLETSLAVSLYTDNDEFDGDKTRKQDPVYSAQFHATHTFANKSWAAVSATFYTGGATEIDGVRSDDLQRNWRTGATLAIPLNRNHSLKFYVSQGVSTRTGTDFDIIGAAWQYRWGGGF